MTLWRPTVAKEDFFSLVLPNQLWVLRATALASELLQSRQM